MHLPQAPASVRRAREFRRPVWSDFGRGRAFWRPRASKCGMTTWRQHVSSCGPQPRQPDWSGNEVESVDGMRASQPVARARWHDAPDPGALRYRRTVDGLQTLATACIDGPAVPDVVVDLTSSTSLETRRQASSHDWIVDGFARFVADFACRRRSAACAPRTSESSALLNTCFRCLCPQIHWGSVLH